MYSLAIGLTLFWHIYGGPVKWVRHTDELTPPHEQVSTIHEEPTKSISHIIERWCIYGFLIQYFEHTNRFLFAWLSNIFGIISHLWLADNIEMNRYLVGEWSSIKPIKVPVRVLAVKCLRLPLLRLRLSAPKGRVLSGPLDEVEVEVFNTL